MSGCALICIISFLSFFASQFSAPFCPEKLNNFLFWQESDCLVGVKMSFSAVSSCCLPQARLPDRSPCDGTGARSGAAGALLLMAVPGRGRQGQRAPSAPPRQSGPRHTQSACVRRHKAASKEPTKQRSRLPLPNIMSLCSVCLVGNPAAQARHSAFSLPCHISRRFSARAGSLLRHTRTQRPTPGEVRAFSLPLRRAGSYLDVQPGCVPLHVLEGGSRAAGAALLAEQPEGVQQAVRQSKPLLRLPGGCVGKHELSSHPHPDVALLDEPQPLLGYLSHSPPADLLSCCTFVCSPCVLQVSQG